MNISYSNDPKFHYQQSILNPYINQSINKQGIANSQILQGSPVHLPNYSTQGRNQSNSIFSTPSAPKAQLPFIQQSIPQSIIKPIVRSPSPINQQKFHQTQPIQSRNIQYYESPQVQKAPQVKIVHEIEQVPIIHELHHVNRPINVISMDEIEVPWRSKQILLEKQLIELQLMLRRNPQERSERKKIIVEDEARIKELEQEIAKLRLIVQENEQNIQNYYGQVEQAQQNIENAEEQASEQIEEQNRELAKWKKKFQDLNKKYHDLEEEITMTEAQIESIQKRKMTTQKITSNKITSNSRVRDSGLIGSSVKKNY
ncbi:unnamed protein product [Paramecium primaurelia]|uniref:Uncharacterized protein n=1 Tax=Paramecium primaurelia TaxID=5886 RepID=A0A8S1NYZ8_PARPR|nr:unnamed protein product [Paramecium primaurelia]